MRIPSAIYPFSSQLLPIVDIFNELQSIFSLNAILSPTGIGLTGRDAGYSCNRRNTNIVVSDEEEVDASGWSTFHIIRTPNEIVLESSHLPTVMKRAIDRGKFIIYYDFEMRFIPQEILKLRKGFKDRFIIQVENSKFFDGFNVGEGFLKITTPVILVGGLVECPDILGVVLYLTNKFTKGGLHPAVVIRQPIGQLLGFHNINHIFSLPNPNESFKIKELNRYLAAIEHYECPDVFIIEAPDAVIKYNDYDPNGFGILTYMLAQAIRPDLFVCCVPVELAVSKLIENMSRNFCTLLGTPIHAVQVCNIVIDSIDLSQSKHLSYVFVDKNRVQDQIKNESSRSHIPLFDMYSGDGEKLFQCVDSYVKSL